VLEKPPRGAAFATGVICAAQFILQLDFSIVNVALPTIQRELSMAAADLQWIVTGYALTFGSLLLVGGRLADLLGRRRVLAAGLILFALASLGCGLARWPVMLIVARMLQGAAGALVSPSALSLLTAASPEGPARNRALSLWQAATASGATTGIVAGGLLTQYLGWRAIFLVNPPLIAVMLALVPRLPAGDSRTGGSRIDVRGATLITAALAALIYGLTEGQQRGFGSLYSLAALAAAGLLGILFIYSERTAASPMLPASVLAGPTRRTAVTMMVLVGAVLAGYVYFVSLYLQRVHHFTPLRGGLALVPATLTVVLTSTFGTRRLLSRFSVKQVMLGGLTSMTLGQLWLARITAAASYPVGVLPGIVLTAFSIGLVLPAASVAITTGVRGRDQGIAGAMFTTGLQTGTAAGLAILATAAAARTAHASGDLVAGYRLSFLIGASVCVLAVLLVSIRLRAGERPRELAPAPGE
jgi:MFS family permease